jgi:hypothetical protein
MGKAVEKWKKCGKVNMIFGNRSQLYLLEEMRDSLIMFLQYF